MQTELPWEQGEKDTLKCFKRKRIIFFLKERNQTGLLYISESVYRIKKKSLLSQRSQKTEWRSWKTLYVMTYSTFQEGVILKF